MVCGFGYKETTVKRDVCSVTYYKNKSIKYLNCPSIEVL